MKALRLRNKTSMCFLPYASCKQGRDYIIKCAKEMNGNKLAYASVTIVEIDQKTLNSKLIEFGAVVPRLDRLFA